MAWSPTTDRLPFDSFHLRVMRREILGTRVFSALGERETFGTTATGEDLWRGNELTPVGPVEVSVPADAGDQMQIVCEAAADDVAGTGVQMVRMDYITPAGAEASLDIPTSGVAGATDLVIPNIRFVQDLYAIQWGSGTSKTAAGAIKIWKKSDTTQVYSMIALGGNKSLVPNRMVPLGKTLYLQRWHATEAQNKRCAFRLRATTTPDGLTVIDGFLFKDVSYLNQAASPEMSLGEVIPALAIVKVTGWATAINAEGSCHWWGYLIDD